MVEHGPPNSFRGRHDVILRFGERRFAMRLLDCG